MGPWETLFSITVVVTTSETPQRRASLGLSGDGARVTNTDGEGIHAHTDSPGPFIW